MQKLTEKLPQHIETLWKELSTFKTMSKDSFDKYSKIGAVE